VAVLAVFVLALAVSTYAIWQKGLAEQAQRKRAEDNLRVARDAADKMLPLLAEQLKDVPRKEKVRRELLEQALRIYEGFLQEHGDDPQVRLEAAATFTKVGQIRREV